MKKTILLFLVAVLFTANNYAINEQNVSRSDLKKRIKKIESAGKTNEDFFEFAYNESGKLRSYRETYSLADNSWEECRFSYDKAGLLINSEVYDSESEEIGYSYRFIYSEDSVFVHSAYKGEPDDYVDTLIIATDGRLLRENETSFAYNSSGNMVKKTYKGKEDVFDYDNNASVFFNQDFPRWFWQYNANGYFDYYANPNNVVKISYTNMDPDTYSYVYDKDGYPIEMSSDGEKMYVYIYESLISPSPIDELIDSYEKARQLYLQIDGSHYTLAARQDIDVSDELLKDFWDQSYQSIKTANSLLAGNLSESLQGEVKAYKCLAFLHLSMVFGNVATEMDESGTLGTRVSLSALYPEIVEDLTTCADNLYPKGMNDIRLRSLTGAAIIHIQQSDFAKGVDILESAINSQLLFWDNGSPNYNQELITLYLLHAECALNMGKNTAAIKSLNEIDMGRGMNPTLSSGATSQEIKTAIQNKYMLIKGMNYINAVRWGTNKDWPEKYKLLPIPVDALNKNPLLTQNPGWGDGEPDHDIEIEQVQTAGENQHTIAFSLKLPTEATVTGSFVIRFPEGLHLDEQTTALSDNLKANFDLIFTPQGENAWKLEIRPKALKSALRSAVSRNIVNIAYTVDEAMEKGNYTVAFQAIALEVSDGSTIFKENLDVNVDVKNDETGNVLTYSGEVNVYCKNCYLHINSSYAEEISIYMFNGQLLQSVEKPEGNTVFNISNLQNKILVIKGSSGWTKKIIAR